MEVPVLVEVGAAEAVVVAVAELRVVAVAVKVA
jgi:hypothetical protein